MGKRDIERRIEEFEAETGVTASPGELYMDMLRTHAAVEEAERRGDAEAVADLSAAYERACSRYFATVEEAERREGDADDHDEDT